MPSWYVMTVKPLFRILTAQPEPLWLKHGISGEHKVVPCSCTCRSIRKMHECPPMMQNGCVFLPVSRSLLVGPIKSSSCNKTDDTLPCVQGTFLDKVLNSFSWFYASHLLMTIAVVTLLVVHPLPGLGRRGPARLNCDGPAKADFGDNDYHGTTWVGPFQSASQAPVRRELPSSAIPRLFKRVLSKVHLESQVI